MTEHPAATSRPPQPTSGSARLVPRPDGAFGPAAERNGRVVRLRTARASRGVLRARAATRQAGFTAERIPMGLLRRHPILFSDGRAHDAQRAELARFFAPRVVEERDRAHMEAAADRLLSSKPPRAVCRFDVLALRYSVEVSARIVGLTESPAARLGHRLEAFFRQPPLDMSREDLGRTRADWALAAWRGLVPLVRLHLLDVLPAIRARRRKPGEDIVSRLLADGCSDLEILVECATYGTAGMVTTRELIALAAWRLLSDSGLRAVFLAAGRDERLDMLAEMLRLDPVVGRLYRRVTEDLPDEGGGVLRSGYLIEIQVDAASADEGAVGPCPHAFDHRRAVAAGMDRSGFAFGDGAHRCPGRHLALLQAEAMLGPLLERGAELVRPPEVEWSDLLAGYGLRGMLVRWR